MTTLKTWRDDFNSVATNGSTGTEAWASDWEGTEDGRLVSIVRNHTAVRIGGGGLPLVMADAGYSRDTAHLREILPAITATRFADLSGITDAELKYKVQQSASFIPFDASDKFDVQISNNGGLFWTSVKNYSGAFSPTDETISIPSNYLTENFGIRIWIHSGYPFFSGNNKFLQFDYVEISEV